MSASKTVFHWKFDSQNRIVSGDVALDSYDATKPQLVYWSLNCAPQQQWRRVHVHTGPSQGVHVLSYNIAFNNNDQANIKHIAAFVQLHGTDVVCFQEVNPASRQTLVSALDHDYVHASGKYVEHNHDTMLFVSKRHQNIRFESHPLEPHKKRTVLYTTFQVSDSLSVACATAHLESEFFTQEATDLKADQLRLVAARLCAIPKMQMYIFAGDMNLTGGPWLTQENDAVARAGFLDVFTQRPGFCVTENNKEWAETDATWCSPENPMIRKLQNIHNEHHRPDRMLLLDAGNALPVIKSSHVVRKNWSDHYGIMATLVARPSASLAAGVVLGHAIGDALGTTYEFLIATKAQKLMHENTHDGHLRMVGDGPFEVAKGMVTDDTELSMALFTSLESTGGRVDKEDIAKRCVDWLRSPDVGTTTRKALNAGLQGPGVSGTFFDTTSANACKTSTSNGALMRVAPLALVMQHVHDEVVLYRHVREVARITHAHPLVHQICAIYVRILVELLRGGSVHDALLVASKFNGVSGTEPIRVHVTALLALSTLIELPARLPLFEGKENVKPDDTDHQGDISIAFVLGLHAVLHATSFEQGLCNVLRRGGDTDTTGAIAGALLGARFGVHQMPADWVEGVLNADSRTRQHYAYLDKMPQLVERANALSTNLLLVATLNIGVHLQSNLLEGSDGDMTLRCREHYPTDDKVSTCTLNAAHMLAAKHVDVVGIQEAKNAIDRFHQTMSATRPYQMVRAGASAVLWNAVTMGSGVQIPLDVSVHRNLRSVCAVYFPRHDLLFLSIWLDHFSERVEAIEALNPQLKKTCRVPARVMVAMDANDSDATMKRREIRLFNKILQLPTQDTLRTCCEDSTYAYEGDYIYDSQHKSIWYGIPDQLDGATQLYSDHLPVMLSTMVENKPHVIL